MFKEKVQILTVISDKCQFKKCDGSGMITYKNNIDATVTAKPCECRQVYIYKSRLKFANIPEEFNDFTVNSFDTNIYNSVENKLIAKDTKKAAINFIEGYDEFENMGKGLYFHSSTKGSGKTRVAASIGNAIIKLKGIQVKFITTIGLLDQIKKTFDTTVDNLSHTELIDSIRNIKVLILDDIGAERPSAWVNEVFFGILNTRMEKKLITIFTSNVEIEHLNLDEKIKNRIERMAIPVPLPEESIRSTLAKKENNDLQKILFK